MTVKRQTWIIWLSLVLAVVLMFLEPAMIRGFIKTVGRPPELLQQSEQAPKRVKGSPDWDHAYKAEFHQDGVDVVLTLPGDWECEVSKDAQWQNDRLLCMTLHQKDAPEWKFSMYYTDAFDFGKLPERYIHFTVPGAVKAMQAEDDGLEMYYLLLGFDKGERKGMQAFEVEMDSEKTQTIDYSSYIDPALKDILGRSSWTTTRK